MIKKTITTLGLVALIGLSACSSNKIDTSPIEIGRGRPVYSCRITNYVERDHMFEARRTVTGYDLNGDNVVDEALIVDNNRLDGMGLFYVQSLGFSSRKQWKHLLADGVKPNDAWLVTENTRTMTQQERDGLTEMLRYQLER